MTNDPSVLIISTVADIATDAVVKRLQARGIAHKRLNTENYPFLQTFTCWPGEEEPKLFSGGQTLPAPSAIWYRRLRSPRKPEDMDAGIYDFCLQETRSALLGSLIALSSRWMSHPTAVWQSEYKPYQLSVAKAVGLPIPRTLVTNDPAAIAAAFDQFHAMVVKPVHSGHVTQGGEDFSIYTSRVLEQHLAQVDSARLSPAIYQELIPKKFDVRVTVVGQRLFPAAIDSQSDPDAAIDWRQTKNPNLPHFPIILPADVTRSLLELMASLHLAFGAIDMIQTPDGQFIFLEVNPNGQWLWIDDKLALGISDAIAEWLIEGR